MNLQYISDHRGKVTGVFIPIQEWELLRKQLSTAEEPQLSHREEFLEAIEQMQQMRQGKRAKPKLTDFIDELRNRI